MYTLACSDLGKDCHFVAKEETKDEVLQTLKQHAMEAHDMKEEDFTPEFMNQAMNSMKEE